MGKRILFVDDDLYIREAYQEVLTSEGYTVDTAINGEEGLKKLQQGGYDLILLDVMMPTLDGIGVLEELQKNPPQQKNGPIVLLTNLGFDPLVKTAKDKGVTSYIVKAEITPRDLVDMIKKTIGD
ncbi:MAG TPA: response regulator [Patescibacteria group bacterium]|nr:response regulator [Patescibacteria group bacterium]